MNQIGGLLAGFLLVCVASFQGAMAAPVAAQTISRVQVMDQAIDFDAEPTDKPPHPTPFAARLVLLESDSYYHYSRGSKHGGLSPYTIFYFNQGTTTLKFECRVFKPFDEGGGLIRKMQIEKQFFLLGGTLYFAQPVVSANGNTCDVRLLMEKQVIQYGEIKFLP